MNDSDAELLAKLLPTFRLEAEEHLRRIDALLAGPGRGASPAAVEEVFREVHSLKGAARAVGAGELEKLCQEMEAVFAGVKKEDLQLEGGLLDLLFLAADLAAKLARTAGTTTPPELGTLVAQAVRRLRGAAHGREAGLLPADEKSTPPAVEPAPPPQLDTLRVGAERMEQVLVQAEEFLTDKLAAQSRIASQRELLDGLKRLGRELEAAAGETRPLRREGGEDAARGDASRASAAVRLSERLSVAWEGMAELENQGRHLLREAEEQFRSLAAKVDLLIDTVRETLMVPAGNLLEQLPRIVRELARDSGKSADLETAGLDIPVDRRILEALRDPLLHLLRNAVDHGIEPPPERQRLGKPERGRIRLEVSSPSPRRVLLTLADDGAGLDLPRLREAAVREGLLAAEDAATLSEERTAALAFTSGLSSLEQLTSVSGRGLGLPIVREQIERLGGTVDIATQRGQGTTFHLEIPAALAAFRGILTALGERRYIFPAVGVDRVLRLKPGELTMVENREVIELEGAPLPVVRLEEPLSIPLRMHAGEQPLQVVVVGSRPQLVGFAVDEILAEQEFLVKTLGRQLVKVNNFSGAAILEDGGIALILDPEELIASAARAAPIHVPAGGEMVQPTRRRVLVVEDSITARTLLRNILEGAGYAVTTAVDGVDALQQLSAAVFDVVVSDVQMPRMDGFRLTQRIRENFGRLPVVLVTGLESEEDRERGIVVGADAYLVKSRFDQGNLLETLGRLV